MSKSSRQGALGAKAHAKSSKPDFDRKALSILKNLERARNYGNKRKYNAELIKLARKHPEYEEQILSLVWK